MKCYCIINKYITSRYTTMSNIKVTVTEFICMLPQIASFESDKYIVKKWILVQGKEKRRGIVDFPYSYKQIYYAFICYTSFWCCSTNSGKFLLMNCPNEQSFRPNRRAIDFRLSAVVPYRCMASAYLSMLRRDTVLPLSVFIIP